MSCAILRSKFIVCFKKKERNRLLKTKQCIRRLANQAELAAGREVYSHTQAPFIPLR